MKQVSDGPTAPITPVTPAAPQAPGAPQAELAKSVEPALGGDVLTPETESSRAPATFSGYQDEGY